MPSEIEGFGNWLLWMLATRAQAKVDEVYTNGPARPSRKYGTVDGYPVPTPALVGWLLTAEEFGVPLERLGERDSRLNDRQKKQKSLRTIVNKAIDGEPRLFKESWLRLLVALCGLGEQEVQLLNRSRDLEGYPVNPVGLRTAIARTRADLSAAKAVNGNPAPLEEHSGRPVPSLRFVHIAPRPLHLVGRDALLTALMATLSASDEKAGPQIVALCGLGGSGKTSLAAEYAHLHQDEVGLAWQFPAENHTELVAEFGELAALLYDRRVAGDPVRAVHAVLAGMTEPWLLIFDNAPDEASIQGLLPSAGTGQILITSQNSHWSNFPAIDVPVLERGVAAEFLMDRTKDYDSAAAFELAGELDGLPLALEQACAYIDINAHRLASYLALFQERRADLLARGEAGGHSKSFATTWSLAFGQLQKDAPRATGLLRLLACCAPERIPFRRLLGSPPGDAGPFDPAVAEMVEPLLRNPVAVDDAITALRRYSLIDARDADMVWVHRPLPLSSRTSEA